MNSATAVPRSSSPQSAQHAGLIVGMAALAAAGYLAFSDVRVVAAAAGLIVLALWGTIAYHHPRAAVYISFPLLLVAGTKFRIREATDSLDGVVDVQILLELGLFAAIGAAALAAWLASRERARGGTVDVLIGMYVLVALLSVLWSATPTLSLVRGVQLLIVALLAMATVRVLRPSLALWAPCATAGVYTVCCAALAATFSWAAGTVERGDRVRFAWFFVHPIEVGTVAAIAALGILAAILWPPQFLRRRPGVVLLCYPTLLCAAGVLVLTNSRGPMMAFAAGVAVAAFFRLPARVRPAVGLVIAASTLLVVSAGPDLRGWLLRTATDNRAVTRLLLQGQSPDDVLGLSGRMDLWIDVSPELMAHGGVGYGYQASRPVLLEAAAWTPAYAHNAFLQSLLDVGVAGTLALSALVAIALSSALRRGLTPRVRGATAAMAVFLVLNAITTESFAGAPGIDALVLFICALSAASAGRGVSTIEAHLQNQP